MKLNRENLTWVAIAIVAVTTSVVVIANAPPPRSSQDWAAWVQGVGTIAAVGVAVWAGAAPVRHEAQRRKLQSRDFVVGVLTAATHAFESARHLLAAVDMRSNAAFRDALSDMRHEGAAEALAHVLRSPIESWPSPRLYADISRLQGAYTQFARVCDRALMTTSLHEESGEVWTLLKVAAHELEQAQAQATKAADEAYAMCKI